MMRTFVFAARFKADRENGGFVVTFRDVPEAITQGDSLEECKEDAAGALQAAIEGRIMDDLEIPTPSSAKRGEHLVAVPIHTAMKAALYEKIREAGITRVELARRLGIDEKEARRILDPYHSTKVERLEQALATLGCHAELRVA
jgi:antitoxin HicB